MYQQNWLWLSSRLVYRSYEQVSISHRVVMFFLTAEMVVNLYGWHSCRTYSLFNLNCLTLNLCILDNCTRLHPWAMAWNKPDYSNWPLHHLILVCQALGAASKSVYLVCEVVFVYFLFSIWFFWKNCQFAQMVQDQMVLGQLDLGQKVLGQRNFNKCQVDQL